MYYLAACDEEGKCFGFLRKNGTVSEDPDNELEQLMSFKKKADTNETILKINLGHAFLPNGPDFRVVAVKG